MQVGGEGADVELGRWCKLQRSLKTGGSLLPARSRALEALGFSWIAPSDMDDPIGQVSNLPFLAYLPQPHTSPSHLPHRIWMVTLWR